MTNGKSIKIIGLEKILRIGAILVLKKYNPKIVSITGSVGKTSTKEVVYAVLSSKFRVRKTEKNYNNEIGVPLTIIGADSGENSVLLWGWVFLKWLWVMIAPIEYPEILVLEMGADRPGDIKYLTSFIKSNVGVITDFSSSHIEFFKNVEGVAKEKSILVKTLDERGLAVINVDNPYVAKLNSPVGGQLKCNIITFGFSSEAQMKATDFSFNYGGEGQYLKGLSFKLNYKGISIPVRLSNALAKHQIYSALAAVAVGINFGINLVEAGSALENFALPPGRMNLIRGIRNTYIIDDTYNSSPTSATAAINALNEIVLSGKGNARKIIILGDMLELGEEEDEKHEEIGRKISEVGCDIFITVGRRMKLAGEEMVKNGFSGKNIFSFVSPMEAARKAEELIMEGDCILVKGSQGVRMEKVVEKIMQNPQEAGKLLCRQNKHWRKIPWEEK